MQQTGFWLCNDSHKRLALAVGESAPVSLLNLVVCFTRSREERNKPYISAGFTVDTTTTMLYLVLLVVLYVNNL